MTDDLAAKGKALAESGKYRAAVDTAERTVNRDDAKEFDSEVLRDLTPAGVNGAELLDELEKWFGRFIRVTFEGDLALLGVWTVHTHLAVELHTTPRLQLDSIMPESGKTTVLDHLFRLSYKPIQMASTPSPALIPRLLERELRTLLFDEIDRTFRPEGPGTPDLLAIINSGYRVGATRPVLVPTKGGGWEANEMPTHAPVAMAGNSPNLADDTRSRCIRILLMPDVDGSIEDSDWELIEGEARRLHDKIAQFANQVRGQVKGLAVDLPAKCVGRTKEKWRPLKRIAVVAGGRWPAVVDDLIAQGLGEDAAEREAGLRNLPPGVVLMADLHSVWPDHDDLVATRDLVTKLIVHNADYWGAQSAYGKALTEHRFGKLVSQASKVTSRRPGGRGPRGFVRSQFLPVWQRLRIGRPPVGSGASGDTGAFGANSSTNNQMHRNNHLHRSESDPPLCGCGKPLTLDESIESGQCLECSITGGSK